MIVGVLIGVFLAFPVSGTVGAYMGVAVIAGADSIFGGWRAALEGKFQNDVFLSGFAVNVLIAALISFAGDHLGKDLFLAVALVMVWRIFTNLSMIRRYAIVRWKDARSKPEGDSN